MIVWCVRVRGELSKDVALHFEVDDFSHCFLKFFEVNLIDEAKVLGTVVVPKNYN